jgi:hypothetical protein
MSHLLLDGMLGFFGAFLGLIAAAIVLFVWGRRRLRLLRGRLAMRVLADDLHWRSLVAALRPTRHQVTTAMVRRKLRTDVDRCVVAVRTAERLGVAGDTLGTRSAELEVAAEGLDAHLGSIRSVGIDPVLFAQAGDLGITAHRLRSEAMRRANAVAVPGLDELTSTVAAEFAHPSRGGRRRRSLGAESTS